jgi:hypothetical protein
MFISVIQQTVTHAKLHVSEAEMFLRLRALIYCIIY